MTTNWTKQSVQSREHLQIEWLLFFPEWKCTIAGYRNYEILPFEFSKIMEDMKGKFDKAYL